MRLVQTVCVPVIMFVAGCGVSKNSPRPLATSATLDLFVVSRTETPNCKQATDPVTNSPMFLTRPALISAADIASVRRFEESSGMSSLVVRMSDAGAKKLQAATATLLGKQIAIVINGTVISTPTLRSTLSTEFVVTGFGPQQQFDPLFEALTEN